MDFFRFSGKYIILCIWKGICQKKYVPTLPKVFRPVTSKAQIIIWPSLIVSFNGIKISTAHPDQMPHDVVSDQGFHCFLTDFALNI